MLGLLPLTPLTVTGKSPRKPAWASLSHLYAHQLPVSVKRAKLHLSFPEFSFKRPDRTGDLHSQHMGSSHCKHCDPSATATSSSQVFEFQAEEPTQGRSHWFSKFRAGSSLTSTGSNLHPNFVVIFG